ncbi:response regulator [Actinomadura geliboluensis]|uniref:response regulator n=1 Tax=Actinomadura geliboluensis TaxID=882440 RepID=UPI00370FD9C1
MDDEPIKVLLVDDEPMVCAHLRTILGATGDIDVVGEAHDGAEAVEAALRLRPDVILMDLRMPGVDGLAAIERIAASADRPAIVALTTFDADDHVLRALGAGASGFLLKSTPPEDLVGLVRVAADGHTVMSQPVARQLLLSADARRRAEHGRARLIGRLTERETEVLKCLGHGMSNVQIARRLHLTEGTVKGYVSRLLVKLDCANRTQAGLLAYEAGLLNN